MRDGSISDFTKIDLLPSDMMTALFKAHREQLQMQSRLTFLHLLLEILKLLNLQRKSAWICAFHAWPLSWHVCIRPWTIRQYAGFSTAKGSNSFTGEI